MQQTPPDAFRPAAADPVPTEVFADHVVIRPPNELGAKAARPAQVRDGGERAVVVRAEHALKLLSQEFDVWMDVEMERLEQARIDLAQTRSKPATEALYRSVHDLRGQAATLGFPLVGEIADGLCSLMERLGDLPPPPTVVDPHVEAIRAMVREQVRSRDNPVGVALVGHLAELREAVATRLAVK
ncbi:Hpt domain-containing protein [Hansschlegelia plantiphila]|uniref:HPt domain-containing protein n=1 Tax=Hansschlegelia plantiphila TaxID=374655 RepID=A0A9W6J287_9HYPH|nr:Hpt domain-containing protein [Hansschlegelia plantiphila]GLK67949.1 hypothetical protein GCM10008179_15870 [Hansschlegelia plantiphila]